MRANYFFAVAGLGVPQMAAWPVCGYCGFAMAYFPPRRPRRCPCEGVYYCDAVCQQRHWCVITNVHVFGWPSHGRAWGVCYRLDLQTSTFSSGCRRTLPVDSRFVSVDVVSVYMRRRILVAVSASHVVRFPGGCFSFPLPIFILVHRGPSRVC